MQHSVDLGMSRPVRNADRWRT